MKRYTFAFLPLLGSASLLAQSGPSNNVPEAISYQGRVSDAAGVFIGDAAPVNRKVTLKVWSGPTTTAAADLLYAEEQTVTISKGLFSVLIGEGTAVVGLEAKKLSNVSQILNQKERFLGVTVDDGTPTADPEVSPRQRLVSSAFSLRAKYSELSEKTNFADVSNVSKRVQAEALGQPGTSTFDWVSANNMTLNGHTKLVGQNVLEFGVGLAKGQDNGMISYQAFSSGLDIVGAGTGLNDRKVTIHAQGGTDFLGPVNLDSTLNFGNHLGQHINLWGTTFGLGMQNGALYNRVDANSQFVWYKGGSHAANGGDPGGGTFLASLHGGGLYLPSGPVDRGGHGVFTQSFGGGHSIGSQDWTTFSRTARNFAWYLGGDYNGGELNAGNGTTLAVMDGTGLRLSGERETGRILEMGYGVAGKDGSAGVIGYKRYSEGLDIVGAGDVIASRKIKLWARDVYLDGSGEQNINMGGDWKIHNHGGGLEFWYQGNMKSFIAGNGDYNKNSDRNLKKDISKVGSVLEKVLKLNPTTYHYKTDPKDAPLSYGFIAQEAQEVFPEMVSKHDSGTLAIAYEGFIPVAIAAIQEQQKLIEAKDAKIAELEKKLAAATEVNNKQDVRLAAIEKALKLSPAAGTAATEESATGKSKGTSKPVSLSR